MSLAPIRVDGRATIFQVDKSGVAVSIKQDFPLSRPLPGVMVFPIKPEPKSRVGGEMWRRDLSVFLCVHHRSQYTVTVERCAVVTVKSS